MGERSVRSDKKRDVKITVHGELKESIYRLAFITNTPIKNLVEEMIIYALRSKRILHELAPHFVRDVRIDNVLYVGHKDNHVGHSPTGLSYSRIKTRVTEQTFTAINTIAYGLDVRPARVAALLTFEALHDVTFVDTYIKKYLEENLNDYQILELKKIIDYIRRDFDTDVGWASLLSFVIEEVREPLTNLKEKVNTFVIKSWQDK
ncbi:hypothetical protein ABE042_04680 [Viridibacillus arvi]|uniref:hypothetical protein n=1 Tax=Viridibacillus arvi TaxID=263475 RepID=UPI003D287F68